MKYLTEYTKADPLEDESNTFGLGYTKHAFDMEAEGRLWRDSLRLVGLSWKSFRLGNCDPTVSSRYLYIYKEEDKQFFVDTKRSYDCCSAVNSPANNDPSEEQEGDGRRGDAYSTPIRRARCFVE